MCACVYMYISVYILFIYMSVYIVMCACVCVCVCVCEGVLWQMQVNMGMPYCHIPLLLRTLLGFSKTYKCVYVHTWFSVGVGVAPYARAYIFA